MFRRTLVACGMLAVLSSCAWFSSSTPDPDEFIEVDREPQPIISIENNIVYPEVARRSGMEGDVIIQELISKDGSVEKVQVLKSDYPIFEDAAVDAAMKAKYSPASFHGKPLRVWITQTIHFKLREKK